MFLRVSKRLTLEAIMPTSGPTRMKKEMVGTCYEPAKGWLLSLSQQNAAALAAGAGWWILSVEPLHRDAEGTGRSPSLGDR